MATFVFNSNTTVTGTSNADLLLGTDTAGNTNDIVYGLPGDDTINATFSLSTSTVYGGHGNDLVFGNNGNVIYGNLGNDTLGVFSDTDSGVHGNNNTLYGGQGNDTIALDGPATGNVAYGGAGGNVIFFGQQLRSTIDGGQGNDLVEGYGSTALVIYGSDPANSVYGNDTIVLRTTDASTAYGGAGDDSIFSNDGTGNTYYGGGGNDTIFVEFSNAEVLYGNQGNDLLQATNAFAVTEYGGQANDRVEQFYGAHGVLYGQKGDDIGLDRFGSGATGTAASSPMARSRAPRCSTAEPATTRSSPMLPAAIRWSAARGTMSSSPMTCWPTMSSPSTTWSRSAISSAAMTRWR